MDRHSKYLGLDRLDRGIAEGVSLISDLMAGIKAAAGPAPDDDGPDNNAGDEPAPTGKDFSDAET